MSRVEIMARTVEWNRLAQVTWNCRFRSLLPSGGHNPSPSPVWPIPAFYSRGYAKGVYKEEHNDGAEEVVGAGQTTNAAKNEAIGEEMRVDSFVKKEIEETDGDELVEKAKKGVKKVGEKMKDAADYMRGGAETADQKQGKNSTTGQMMGKGADLADSAGDSVKEGVSEKPISLGKEDVISS